MPFPNYGIKKNLYISFKNILMYNKIKRENSRKLMGDMRGTLLVVATVMTIITYQLLVDPPEGV